ncbi:phage major capsid protein [Halobacillus sp. H74]|uniref:phage major capsid protein n=1 Tax=Halobacillus sp. H74 TaxID=3457436 RepID=UPI003FCE0A77
MTILKVKNRAGKPVDIESGSGLTRVLEKDYGSKAAATASSEAYKRYLSDNGVMMKDVVRALGYEDIGKINVRELLDNDGTKPLFNAIVEDGLRMGFERQSNWNRLVASTIPSDQLSQQWYYLQHEDDWYDLRDIGQGAPIPTSTIQIGDNSIKMHKRGRGLEWTDEAKRANIDMVRLWLQKLGLNLGRQYESVAVDRLLNGYFPSGDDSAPTIGVETAGTLTLGDIFYAAKYQEQEKGFSPNMSIMNLNTAYQVTNMREGDQYLYREELKDGRFADVVNGQPFISNQVPDDRIILVDTNFALVRYEGKGFGVESERSAKTQVEGSYGTEISEFVPFEPDARMVLTVDAAR